MIGIHALKKLCAAALLPLVLAGCLTPGEVALKRQFLLAPKLEIAPATPTPHTLGVRPLLSARPYTLNMLYAGEDGALLPRPDVFWAEEPAATLTRALIDALTQSGRFADAGDAANLSRPEYLLTGEVRKFHEDRSSTPARAVIELRLDLRDVRNAKQIWTTTLKDSVPLAGDNPAELAKAMETAIAQGVRTAAESISEVALP